MAAPTSPREGTTGRTAASELARLVLELAGMGALLFVSRFIAQGHLAPQTDQECHIGGIAVDIIAHGVRFPAVAYAPNEYDNGSFVSGLLTAAAFSAFGRNALVLKLVTHAFATAGAVATLRLLRASMSDLGWTHPFVRALATLVLVITLAFAPRTVTMASMYAVGNHAEGTAIDVILLGIFFAARLHLRSPALTAGFWALAGAALYVNKATLVVLPVLGIAQLVLTRRSPRRLVAALGGFVLGVLPELLVVVGRSGFGWLRMAGKADAGSHRFPDAFLSSVETLADDKPELLALWVLALAVGVALALRRRSLVVGSVAGFALLHLAGLSVMAHGGVDAYSIYGYPSISLLVALMSAGAAGAVAARWGERAAVFVGCAAAALAFAAHRPLATSWGTSTVMALARDRAGAACAWRFAEGFGREHRVSGASGAREAHVLARCRSLSEEELVADCVGGIARELTWRHGGHVDGAPPAGLTDVEQRTYAYLYGTHRGGDETDCADFDSAELAATCASAVRLECLVFGDIYTRMATGRPLGRPSCTLAAPPVDGYWAARFRDTFGRTSGGEIDSSLIRGDDDASGCEATFAECYPEPPRGE